jgi:ubiquinone/menaquinone biosynthesis C-methylase UbiE
MAQARELDRESGLSVAYVQAHVENARLPDCSFDVITAGQCWHWFKRDVAANEAFRLLRANGVLVIAHFDWLPLRSSVVEATEALILAHNPSWKFGGGNGVYGQQLRNSL